MRSFSSLYKRTFKQLLFPFGYQLHQSLFYKEVNREMCFFITAKKVRYTPHYQVYFGVIPYCYDLIADEFEWNDAEDWMQFDSMSFLERLNPDLFTIENRETVFAFLQDYHDSRLYADSEDEAGTLDSLHAMCADMQSDFLPFFHQFIDLECYYKEIAGGKRFLKQDLETYGLSLKLHHYENALACVQYYHSRSKQLIQSKQNDIDRLQSGIRNEVERRILRKKPDYVQERIEAARRSIAKEEQELLQFQRMQEALLARDIVYLDGVVAETEKKSRVCFRKWIGKVAQ